MVRPILKSICFGVLVALVSSGTSAKAGFIDLAVNGSFNTGDTTGWTYFPTGSSSFNVISSDFNSAPFSAVLLNSAIASAAVIKQANVGVGTVNPGDQIEICFAAKGFFGNGGVAFAELFSELSGGGTSQTEILGGGPLAVTSNWQNFMFTTTAGPNVSGGITLQFAAVTGANPGSVSVLLIDSVQIKVVPEPSSFALLSLCGLALVRRRRV